MQLQIFIEPCIYRILADIKCQIKTKNKKKTGKNNKNKTKTIQKQQQKNAICFRFIRFFTPISID